MEYLFGSIIVFLNNNNNNNNNKINTNNIKFSYDDVAEL